MTRVLSKAVLTFLLLGMFQNSLKAEPLGGAFVQAPELSIGVCFATSPEKGFACARKKCIAKGGDKQSCWAIKWCYPAGWSADVFLQSAEGLHWHEYLCGWPSKADAIAAARVRCEGSQRGMLRMCNVVGLWTPDGKRQKMPDDS